MKVLSVEAWHHQRESAVAERLRSKKVLHRAVTSGLHESKRAHAGHYYSATRERSRRPTKAPPHQTSSICTS
jgi:hypothetical protein